MVVTERVDMPGTIEGEPQESMTLFVCSWTGQQGACVQCAHTGTAYCGCDYCQQHPDRAGLAHGLFHPTEIKKVR